LLLLVLVLVLLLLLLLLLLKLLLKLLLLHATRSRLGGHADGAHGSSRRRRAHRRAADAARRLCRGENEPRERERESTKQHAAADTTVWGNCRVNMSGGNGPGGPIGSLTLIGDFKRVLNAHIGFQ
jgi:uncharacterized protein HemY